jgi:hypothetical protein
MAEGWLLNPAVPPQGSVAACVRTAAPPNLNGVFSEACWNGAAEIPLSTGPGTPLDSDSHPLVMLCHDGEHLYVAASLPRVPGTRIDGPAEKGRRYDEDISDFDRISFHFDVDRDYVTYYSFSVDQRGCTTESCWGDATWNVRWFVKVVADEDQWRVEAAIPLAELVPRAPGRGTVWNVGVVRTIPAVGLESWTHPASPTPRPETFGLLKFD